MKGPLFWQEKSGGNIHVHRAENRCNRPALPILRARFRVNGLFYSLLSLVEIRDYVKFNLQTQERFVSDSHSAKHDFSFHGSNRVCYELYFEFSVALHQPSNIYLLIVALAC